VTRYGMTRLVPLRRGEPRGDGDDRCPSFRAADMVDRCSSRALPHHDLHSTGGVDPDGEVYGCAWITRAALPVIDRTHRPCCSAHGVDMTCERYRRTHFVEVRPCCAVDAERLRAERAAALDPSVVGAILGLAFATDETTARYWLAACARAGIEQPTLDDMWRRWQDENTPTVITTDERNDR
jgi:hypothetical protein